MPNKNTPPPPPEATRALYLRAVPVWVIQAVDVLARAEGISRTAWMRRAIKKAATAATAAAKTQKED